MGYRNTVLNIVNSVNAERVAEIGVHTGYLTDILCTRCLSIKEYYAIDPWKEYSGSGAGTLAKIEQEQWEIYYQHVKDKEKVYPFLKVIRKPSKEAVIDFEDGYFDVIFIDADHSYESAKEDMRLWLPKIKKGGILCGHDYGKHYPGVVQAYIETFGCEAIPETTVWKWKVEGEN